MEINIKRYFTYMEMEITANDMIYNTGLLDENESIELAKELIYAAEMLLPGGLGERRFITTGWKGTAKLWRAKQHNSVG